MQQYNNLSKVWKRMAQMSVPSKWEIMMHSFHGVPKLELSECREQLFDRVAKTEIFSQKGGSSMQIRELHLEAARTSWIS